MNEIKIVSSNQYSTGEIFIGEIDLLTDGTYDKVILNDILDMLPERETWIHKILRKVKFEGFIILSGLDLDLFSRKAVYQLSVSECNNLLYNKKFSISNLPTMVSLLESNNYDIVVKRYVEPFAYYVEGRRRLI